jgi:hypothetical protein
MFFDHKKLLFGFSFKFCFYYSLIAINKKKRFITLFLMMFINKNKMEICSH